MESDGPHLIQVFNPATFVERGIALAFTSPLLAGTRARPDAGDGLELVVPNPAGGKGCYILDWASTRTLCRPTVHDHHLIEHIRKLPSLTPRALREATRAVAGVGFAGREAARAASEADQQIKGDWLVTNYHFLEALVRQVGQAGLLQQARGPIAPADMEVVASKALQAIAPELRSTREAIALALEGLSWLFVQIGVGPQAATARIPTLVARMSKLRADMMLWAERGRDDTRSSARMIGAVCEMTLFCAAVVIERARQEAVDTIDLVRRWQHDPQPIGTIVSRPEWIIDGWDAICELWSSATNDVVRRERLDEIVRLLPVVPKEMLDWIERPMDLDAPFRRGRTVFMGEDWRTGSRIIELTARNESLLASALRVRAREAMARPLETSS